MKVLVIGSGGREHALAWKISQSPLVDTLYCAPGNGGTQGTAHNVEIKATDIDGLLHFALQQKIDLTVVGPEAPLVEGIVDIFQAKGLAVFGPAKKLARLEGSKVFAKQLMEKYGVPTAAFEVFDTPGSAKEYVRKRGVPIVVKAEGLAAGKGVIVASSLQEAEAAIDTVMVKKAFGTAGDRVIIEECLEGEEVSILVITDGTTIVPLASSQDHKRAFDSDRGPNTGGMGAYSPAPVVTDKVFAKIMDTVFKPLIAGLKDEGEVYKGVLYGGLMIREGEPFVLEFNVRFGDPETQAILPKLKSDFAEIIFKAACGQLQGTSLSWDPGYCVCVVLTSGGYPGSYQKGKVIEGLEKLGNREDTFVFHAGTRQHIESGSKQVQIMTDGGRVLNVVGIAPTLPQAQEKVYDAIGGIYFDKMHYRRDIGSKALQFLY